MGMKWWRLALVLLPVGLVAQEEEAKEPSGRDRLVQGLNTFACELYREVRTGEGNLFLSPFAVATAGALLAAGTAGETEAELNMAFHLPPRDELLSLWPGLRRRLGKGLGEDMTLRFANAVCVDRSTPLLPSYQSALKEAFSVPWYGLDFRGDPDGCVREINAWAAKMTKQEGSDLLKPEDVHPSTRLVLVSASYFKGTWDEPFSRNATRPRTFHLDAERETEVPTMRRKVEQGFANRDWFAVVPLAYEDSSIEMVLLVPRQVDGLTRLEDELDAEKLTEWLDEGKDWQNPLLTLYLPRFDFRSSFDLAPPLAESGVKHLFSEQDSDFSPMFGPEALAGEARPQVSRFVHTASVRVDEEGTVASSETAAMIEWGGPTGEVTLRVDHPFLFLIRERKTGLILYLGRVVDPRQE